VSVSLWGVIAAAAAGTLNEIDAREGLQERYTCAVNKKGKNKISIYMHQHGTRIKGWKWLRIE